MKSSLFNLLLIWLCFSAASTVQAQSDSVRTEYKMEDEKISSAEIKRFIRYITRANVEEKTLIKLGIWPTTDRASTFDNRKLRVGANAELSIEQKLTPALSLFVGVDAYVSYATYRLIKVTNPIPTVNSDLYYTPEETFRTEFTGKAGFRYYHDMTRRIRKGKSANNFSGNYIMAQVAEAFRGFGSGKYYNPVTEDRFSYRSSEDLLGDPQPRITLAYGIQRRLGRRGYFDINAGPEVLFTGGFGTRSSFQLNALIGLGW